MISSTHLTSCGSTLKYTIVHAVSKLQTNGNIFSQSPPSSPGKKMQQRTNPISSATAHASSHDTHHHATSNPPPSPEVAIIGGGLAGLSAAHRLAQLNISSTVFDMGTRVLGGRACSRVLSKEGLQFDHGAQFLAPRSTEFSQAVQNWVRSGAVAPWKGRFGAIHAETMESIPLDELSESGFCGILDNLRDDDEKKKKGGKESSSNSSSNVFVGLPNMGGIAAHLAEEIEQRGSTIKLGHKITGLHWDDVEQLWTVLGIPRSSTSSSPSSPSPSASTFGTFKSLIIADALVALPDSAGFAAGLLESSDLPEVTSAVEKIQTIRHQSVFTLMVAFERSLDNAALPFDAMSIISPPLTTTTGENEESDEKQRQISGFQWISRNSAKPGPASMIKNDANEGKVPPETWVAISTPQKANELLQRWPLHTLKGAYNPQTQEYRDAVAKELVTEFLSTIKAVSKEIELPATMYVHAQRWGRGFVVNPLSEQFLAAESGKFAACGDFCCDGGQDGFAPAEAAWRSGHGAAGAVAAWLAK